MKKTVQTTFFLCLLLSALTTQAQMTLGLRAGVNLATYNFNFGSTFPASSQPNQPDNVALLSIGVPFQMAFSEHFALQMELNFLQKGYRQKSDVTFQNTRFVSDGKIVVNWLELPILAKARFGSEEGIGGGVFFGPSIGYGLSGKFTSTSTSTTNGVSTVTANSNDLNFKDDEHSRVDLGLNIGGEVNYGGVFLDIRYQIGLTNMVSSSSSGGSSDISARTRGLAFTAGYRLPISAAEKPSKKTKK
jgi:hypothetical protein